MDWYVRTLRQARYALWCHTGGDLTFRAGRLLHRWAGHASRHPELGPCMRWQNARQWREDRSVLSWLDPRNLLQWRHPRPGRPKRWEDPFLRQLGEAWHDEPPDREAWAAGEVPFAYSLWKQTHSLRLRPEHCLMDGPLALSA